MPLNRANQYLKNVINMKEIIPFRRFMGGVGRHAQVRMPGSVLCMHPVWFGSDSIKIVPLNNGDM